MREGKGEGEPVKCDEEVSGDEKVTRKTTNENADDGLVGDFLGHVVVIKVEDHVEAAKEGAEGQETLDDAREDGSALPAATKVDDGQQ